MTQNINSHFYENQPSESTLQIASSALIEYEKSIEDLRAMMRIMLEKLDNLSGYDDYKEFYEAFVGLDTLSNTVSPSQESLEAARIRFNDAETAIMLKKMS